MKCNLKFWKKINSENSFSFLGLSADIIFCQKSNGLRDVIGAKALSFEPYEFSDTKNISSGKR
jgi:hypothetical protein